MNIYKLYGHKYHGNAAGIYLLKVDYRKTRTRCDMFKFKNKNTRTMPSVFIVNFEHISYLVTYFLPSYFFLNTFLNFEYVTAGWEGNLNQNSNDETKNKKINCLFARPVVIKGYYVGSEVIFSSSKML